MKLNPPASSSDLDAARAIARRLHRRALGHERATDHPRELPGLEAEPTPPVGPVSSAEATPPAAEPVAPAAPPAEPLSPEPPPPAEPSAFEPSPFETEPAPPAGPPPSTLEPEPSVAVADETGATEPEPAAATVLETNLPEPPVTEGAPVEAPTPEGVETFADEIAPPDLPQGADETVEPPEAASLESLASEAEAPEEPSLPDAPDVHATPAEGVTAPPDIDVDTPLGDLGASDQGNAVLEGLEPPAGGGSPEDLLTDATQGWPEGNPLEDQIETEAEPERAPDDLVAPPTSPTWDDVTDSCLALARAHGAMVVDPSGQVLAARGDWPEPGPEAIGGRLVSMMEKTLRDAPTRSVSAPLAGRHLTAWRVPAGEGYYTIVFMGDAPLGADVRSPVDVEIKRALGP